MSETVTFLAQTDRMDAETFNVITMTRDLSQMVRMSDEMTEEETLTHFKERGMPDKEAANEVARAKSGAYEAVYGRLKIRLVPREHGGYAFEFQDKFTGETFDPKYTDENDRGKARQIEGCLSAQVS